MPTVLARFARPAARLSLRRMLSTVLALRRQRRDLARLDNRLLEDIGLSADRARAEAARPVWDVPPTWRI